MGRKHIHLTPFVNNTNIQQSGIRANCDILIYVDMESAMDAGIEFWLSDNNVILTEGDETGCLSSKFFLKIVNKNKKSSVKKYCGWVIEN